MITIKDRQFEVAIDHAHIAERVEELARKINADYEGRCPIILVILNGAFIFAADLVRHLHFDHEICFAQFASYNGGMKSSGRVRDLMDVSADVKGRDVIVVEDIVETGTTIAHLLPLLREKGAASVEVAALLMKPTELQVSVNVKYCAFALPKGFLAGYGLDYNGLGRNLKDIYEVRE